MSAAMRVGSGGLGFIRANSDAQPAVTLKLHEDATSADAVVWTFPTALPDEGETQYVRVDDTGQLSYGTPASAAWTNEGDNLAYNGGGTVLVGTVVTDAPGTYALEVDGSARFGRVVAPQIVGKSDRRLKTDICPIAPQEATRRLQGLVGVDYVLCETGHKATGILAQDVQDVQPWSVSVLDGATGYLGVEYNHLTGLLVAGFQALLVTVDTLKAEVTAMQDRILALESQRSQEA
jgi:hypothetical protein